MNCACLGSMLAHNLTRALQMQSGEREFGTSQKRRPLWTFESLKTIRQRLVKRAARLIRPQGRLTLDSWRLPAGSPAIYATIGSSLDFEIVYWVLSADYNFYRDIQQSINFSILRRLTNLGVSFAYPTRTVPVASSNSEASNALRRSTQVLEPAQ